MKCWIYGFKLHIATNHFGDVASKLNPVNTDDNSPYSQLLYRK
ncbi:MULTISPECIES: transposase [Vibrio]|nr:hypothetical protein [Vibrio parahaemolyticus]EHY0932671.1 hypothetical protein [Vibrio parahaemolyticus]EIZ0311513.1 hypothetical protein [Vibrio parahaemolyticus]EJE8515187.1 hypothetical protein [Vibrio parahaemolyticus]EJE8774016.1 hypothetical protein [Vibrio parahaemolyticus]